MEIPQSVLELAAELEKLAMEAEEKASSGGEWGRIAAQARPIVRRLDADAAMNLERDARTTVGSSLDSVQAGVKLAAILRGVAKAARIDGAAVTGTSPMVMVNASAEARAEAVVLASIVSRLDVLVQAHSLPAEAVAKDIMALKEAVEQGDAPGFLEKAATMARHLKEVGATAAATKNLFDIVGSALQSLS